MNRYFQKTRNYYFTMSDRINRCNANQRIVIGIIVWALVFILWFVAIGLHIKKMKNVQTNKQRLLVHGIQQKQNQINAFVATTGSKTDVIKYQQLIKERAELDTQIQAYSKHLVPIRRVVEAFDIGRQFF